MAKQFDVYLAVNGRLAVVIQSDLLDASITRVIVPLLPVGDVGRGFPTLNPVMNVGDARLVLMPQLMATLTLPELGEHVGSLAHRRDVIIRAVDALLSGL